MATTTLSTNAKRVQHGFHKADELDKLYRAGQLTYVLGGGHPTFDGHHVDCSGLVSIVARAMGELGKPRPVVNNVTWTFEGWGEEGWGVFFSIAVHDDPDPNLGTHHCACNFNLERGEAAGLKWHENPHAVAANGWCVASHTGGPVGWQSFDSTNYNIRRAGGL